MSGLDCVFQEFCETSKTENVIIGKHRTFDDYSIKLYCLENNIDINKEKQRLIKLCLKHGIGYKNNN